MSLGEMDFGAKTALPLIGKYDNLLVVQTNRTSILAGVDTVRNETYFRGEHIYVRYFIKSASTTISELSSVQKRRWRN